MVTEISASEFKSAVIEADVPVLVDFYADWCGPCLTQAPILEQVASKLGASAQIKKVNIDRDPELAGFFEVRSIPTLILFSDGTVAKRFDGLTQGSDLIASVLPHLRSEAHD
jgi:thioredoxin 1